MPISKEMRRLQKAWETNTKWPKRLEWLEIENIRGWSGQRVDFSFPIVAIVGENGSGKSTLLQASAVAYRSRDKDRYASDFFPDTPFEKISTATIRYSYKQGTDSFTKTIRKPTNRWRGNPERPDRPVQYVDLRRIQPVSARSGHAKLLKRGVTEDATHEFDRKKITRLNNIVGKRYSRAGISLTDAGPDKPVPVLELNGVRYSGFHQGAGEIAAAELLAVDYPKYGLILIDEVETSLHPRAQRRLIRDLATIARENELQIILSTHSPYVLEELPPQARLYIMDGAEGKTVVTGVSPEFAMTRMDEEQHPECDVYVEDSRAMVLVREAILQENRDTVSRIKLVSFGSAGVGKALGIMNSQCRFPRPSVIFLDGDQDEAEGCERLPSDDAPEIMVFNALHEVEWAGVAEKISRQPAETIDALNEAMLGTDHHDWVTTAANRLTTGADTLWQALCSAWAARCAPADELESIYRPVSDALDQV